MDQKYEKLFRQLQSGKALIMLAPSFPIDFKFPAIIGMLRELGFDKVTELTFGARIVNHYYRQYIEGHPDQQYFIASPCPTCDLLIKKRYPSIEKYLVPLVSPMAAMAKVAKKQFPDHFIVFASPCSAKQTIEAPKYKDSLDQVITFKELRDIFSEKNITEENTPTDSIEFDSFFENETRIYPISGGLTGSSEVGEIFDKKEILITDGSENLKVLQDIENGTSPYRFIDILNCRGGCIGGPAFANRNLPLEEKQQRVLEYQSQMKKTGISDKGDIKEISDLNFDANYLD